MTDAADIPPDQVIHRVVRGERVNVTDSLPDEIVAAIDGGLLQLYNTDTGEPIPLRCSCGERLLWNTGDPQSMPAPSATGWARDHPIPPASPGSSRQAARAGSCPAGWQPERSGRVDGCDRRPHL